MNKFKNIIFSAFAVLFLLMCSFGCISTGTKNEENKDLQNYYKINLNFTNEHIASYSINKKPFSENKLKQFLGKISKSDPNIHLYVKGNVKVALIFDQILLFKTAKIKYIFLHFSSFDEEFPRDLTMFVDLVMLNYIAREPIPEPPKE